MSVGLNLTRYQIRNSPNIDTEKPVSRQMTMELSKYYGWPMAPGAIVPPLITPFGIGPVYPYTGVPAPTIQDLQARPSEHDEQHDPHLRSMKEITGYRIEVSDGDVGRVKDFAFDLTHGEVTQLIVEATDDAVKSEIGVNVGRVQEIRWVDRRVRLRGSAAGLASTDHR